MLRALSAVLHTPGEVDRAIDLTIVEPPTESPLVSCLMVSRGRLFPGRHAIACFQRQTYPNRELVVVIDDPSSELPAHVLALDDPRIRLIELPAETRTLGELRNISVASAGGEYICQWDDDDLYAPERIEIQLAALRESGAAACALRGWTIWWPNANRLAISGARIWEGSILARKRDLPPYPALRRGEDTEMIEALALRDRIVSLDAPGLYVYVHHRRNTFGLAHFTAIYNFSRQRWIGIRCDEQLDILATTMPIRDYEAGLQQSAQSEVRPSRVAGGERPLVSIVVRSMGRSQLRAALDSLAAQDYPSLEVIVVDATGGRHPALPEFAWSPGHSLRMVNGDRPLSRPQAANAGLDTLRGQWFGFLDDDDTFDPDHVSHLMTLAATTDDLAVYGMSRLLSVDGETTSITGLPFNNATVFLAPLCSFPAAIFRRDVITRGCRFDERLEIFEDQDFFRQIALLSGFTRSGLATFNYHIESGTSGTGRGANRDWTRGPLFEQRLRAKWAGQGTYHEQRILLLMRRSARAFHDDRDHDRARTLLRSLLDLYPDEPNALNATGYMCLEAGELEEAETFLRRAVDINSSVGEYRFNLACLLDRTGRRSEARRELQVAVADRRDPRVREAALQLLARLSGSPPGREPVADRAGAGSGKLSRLVACPCGSGKRHKHCCGRPRHPAPGTPADTESKRAIAAFHAGEAAAAMAILDAPAIPVIAAAATAMACGDICREMRRYERACAFYQQASALGETLRVSTAVAECCSSWYKPERDASILRVARDQVERINKQRITQEPLGRIEQPIHIIGALGKIGGSEHRALGLHAFLSRHTPTRLWSTVPPMLEFAARYPIETMDESQGHFPESGHLVFVGTYFEYGLWLERSRPTRVTICFNIALADTLLGRLLALQEIASEFTLDLTYPSRSFRDAVGLPGVVEYSLVDIERFRPLRLKENGAGPLVIGRHSRDDRMKFHPNDPALFRTLVREGHQLEIVGGTCLAQALAPDTARGGITLRPEGSAIVPFLDGLDCFLYRGHPGSYEAGGTVIAEAMAMALPVIVFNENVGIAELIEHGKNGYLVDTEDQALAHVRELQHDPLLRRAIGAAARATMIATMRSQQQSLLDCYLPHRQYRGV